MVAHMEVLVVDLAAVPLVDPMDTEDTEDLEVRTRPEYLVKMKAFGLLVRLLWIIFLVNFFTDKIF